MGHRYFRLLACSFVAMGLLLASFVLGPVSALADTTDPSAPATGTDPGSSTGTGTGTDTSGGTTGSDTGPSDTGTTGSDPQSGGTQTSDPSSPTSTDTGTTDPTQVPDSTSSTSPGALDTETTPSPLTLTITDHPTSVSTAGTGAFTWSTNQASVSFSCQLDRVAVGASLPGTPAECGKTTTDTTLSSGTTYTGLKFGRYTFTVIATSADGTQTVKQQFGWQIGELFSPAHNGVTTGASFNNPYGTASAQRRNLHRIIVAVNSMPGYLVNVPAVMCDRDHVPSTIRITVYSMTDLTLARALRNASDRCVSVQVLMDGHLTPKNTKSVALLESALGNHVYTAAGSPRRSFSHRCHAGCRGGGVLHTKMYLFDSDVAAPSGPTIKNSVLAGSSNMTSNASKVQWNDLYGVPNRPTLYSQFLSVFNRMKRDRDERRTLSYTDGIYRSVFTPITPGSADPLMSALRSIHCVGATSGNAGHTVVYINIHAWFESRGYALAQRVRSMSFHGCQINVLYSFMSKSVFNVLRTSPRMSLRRTAFPKRDGIHAAHYSHFKMIAANGYVGSSRGARVVWTGSNNFTNDGTHFDELTLRIASGTTYGQYARQFAYMRSTHSTSVYAKLLEPIGGGRPINSHV